jgi:orotate phosphoribosyltransferase
VVSANPPPSVPTKDEILQMLLAASAVRFGDFTLASGEKSDVYIDVKRAWPNPQYLEMLGRAFAARVGATDRLAGMELGAVPLVVATALRTGHPYVVLRKAAKEHGTRQQYEGEIRAGDRVLLIEDVSTTGGSAVRSIEIIRGAGGVIDRMLVVIDRESGTAERLGALGVRVEPLATFSELRRARP